MKAGAVMAVACAVVRGADGDLAVPGKLTATGVETEELTIKDWKLSQVPPDYVLEEGYALPSLDEVKSFIEQHGHLPEMPSARQMRTEGIDIVQMNFVLLKKIEELTLHLIGQQETIRGQQVEIDALKKAATDTHEKK
jgi:hypothetical protein